MSRRNTRSQAAVERLLDERRQYQDWLAKLAAPTAAGAPSPVLERVRADYQARLDAVTDQLSRHEGELEAALAEAEQRRDQAAGERAARQDALAEAALRHEVGEFDDARYAALSAEHSSASAQLGEEIEVAGRDIARLEEVLALIARVFPEAPPSPAAAPTAPPSAAGPGPGVPALGGLDELSFLWSVAGSPRGAAAAPAGGPVSVPPSEPVVAPAPALGPRTPGPSLRVSRPVMPPGAAPQPALPPRPLERAMEPPAADLEPVPAAASPVLEPLLSEPGAGPPPPERSTLSRRLDAPLPAPLQQVVPEVPDDRASRASRGGNDAVLDPSDESSRKTLRCTECGTPNLPTEWYCEKCGAELSAF